MHKLPQRFRNARVIGEGAAGVVYDTWDQVRAERVALKTLHKASSAALRDFKHEFRAVAELSHENLVMLHELFYEEELWFFTMELVRGAELLSNVAHSHERALESLRDLLVQLARGVSALHQVGVVHRDIKPQNVLVQADGRVVLLDYGMVTALQTPPRGPSERHLFTGTPGYVAPEQVFGESLTFASDWYSFGCVLYEALTGMLPFEDGKGAILMRKLSNTPTPPSRLNPSVPEDLEKLCVGLLERQPSRRPDAAQVLRVLGDAGPVSRPSVVPSSRRNAPVFVGRKAEWLAISDWLESGTVARMAVLSGVSGIGKTTLAEAVIGGLGRDALLLRSRCLKQEIVPFNAWDGIIDELSAALARLGVEREAWRADPALCRLFPVLALGQGPAEPTPFAGDPAELRSEAARALRELFLDLCGKQRVVMSIDDLQWADADSLRLLRELMIGPLAPPLSLLVTLRPGEGESASCEALLTELAAAGHCKTFGIGPLPATESLELLGSFTQLRAELRAAVLDEADGNPFLLTELARGAEQGDGSGRIRLSNVLADRMRRLSQPARALFEVVGVSGRPLPLTVALSAAGIRGQGLREVHRLRASGLIRWGGLRSDEEVETYHDRWRTALDAALDGSRRSACFEALANAYAERHRSDDAEMLASCYQRCGKPELAAQYALTAARNAEVALAFERALDGYTQALELGVWSLSERTDLLIRVAENANAAGRGLKAGNALREAALLVDNPRRIDLIRRAAQAFMSSGHQTEGEKLLREVLGAVGDAPPRSMGHAIVTYLAERWRLERRGLQRRLRPLSLEQRQRVEAIDVAAALWMNHNPLYSWTYGKRELRWLLDGDDDRLLLRALSRDLVFASSELHRAAWIEGLIALGEQIAPRVSDPACLAFYQYALTLQAFLAGEWLVAMQRARDVERFLRTECTGVHWELSNVRRVYVAAVQIEGDMVAVEAALHVWLEDAEQREDREAVVTHLLGLGYCHLCRDQLDRIAPLLTRLRALLGNDHSAAFNLVWIEAMTLCYESAPAAALSDVLSRLRRVHRSANGRVAFYRIWTRGYESRVLGALAASTEGRERERWLKELRRLRRRLAPERWQYAVSVAKEVEATLAWFTGDVEHAARLLGDSAVISERTGARLFAAVARLVSAQLRGDTAARGDAVALMRGLNVVDVDRMARAHLPAFEERAPEGGARGMLSNPELAAPVH